VAKTVDVYEAVQYCSTDVWGSFM